LLNGLPEKSPTGEFHEEYWTRFRNSQFTWFGGIVPNGSV
jgi:hypothetical protein